MGNAEAGERIRKLREAQNCAREDFAERVEISCKFLYEIETGKKGFSADTLCRIARALSVSCDDIMFGEKKEYQNVERIAGVLEGLNPLQLRKMYDILKIVCDMCDVFEKEIL